VKRHWEWAGCCGVERAATEKDVSWSRNFNVIHVGGLKGRTCKKKRVYGQGDVLLFHLKRNRV